MSSWEAPAAPIISTGTAGLSSVFELRHRLQLILGRVVDGVIRIPVSVGLPVVRRRRRSARGRGGTIGGSARIAVDVRRRTIRGGRRGACRGRPRRLIGPLQLVIGD